ncbi:MAG TPA: hypothetical protein VLJ20_15135 [Acetobacteraceae bacterium]|nr:hypothetical protein [Acetobacteraceae bacterium]
MDRPVPDRDAVLGTLRAREAIAVGERIGEALGGVQVDLATRGSLHPVLRPAIEASAVRVF